MKLTGSRGGVRMRLSLPESQVLTQMFSELQDVLEPGALSPSDPVRARLYPAGYGDAEDARSFRELTEGALRQDRSDRLDQCLADLVDGRALMRTDVTLDADAAQRWLRVLNDLRLTLGTRLEIAEDDELEILDADPEAPLKARYLWLTALQDGLVQAVMG